MSLPLGSPAQQQQQESSPAQRIYPILTRHSSGSLDSPLVRPQPLKSAFSSPSSSSSFEGGQPTPTDGASSIPSRPRLAPSSRGSIASISSFGGIGLSSSSPSQEQGRERRDWGVKTERFTYVRRQDGDFILTGREGKLARCEDEPIRLPGAVQAYGCLLAFDQLDDGRLPVMQISENSDSILGFPPHEFLTADSLASLLPEDCTLDLADALDIYDRPLSPGRDRNPHPFTMTWGEEGMEKERHCVVHRPSPIDQPRRAILEVELVDDQQNPLAPPPSPPPSSAEIRISKLGLATGEELERTQEELDAATESALEPLHELGRWKKRKQRGGSGELDYLRLLADIQEQLSLASQQYSRDVFLNIVARIYKEICSFSRVMIYQFDEEHNGHVVAEQADVWKLRDVFRGLVWPASDIPPQARELYRINKIRLLYDRDQPTARICCRDAAEVDNPLDMTHCYLRAMSPVHLKYLKNMDVKSSMSVSLHLFGRLYALVAMHDYGEHGRRVPPPIRRLCVLIADSVSINLERLIYREQLEAKQVINAQVHEQAPSIASPPDLLGIMNADHGCLTIGGSTKLIGKVDDSTELLSVVNYLRQREPNDIICTNDIKADFPELTEGPTGVKDIAGFLAVPLSFGSREQIVFFRKGQDQVVNWAGNPFPGHDEITLEPRTSFKLWRQLVTGKCTPWTETEQQHASTISFVYGRFIKLWRESEGHAQSGRLNKMLMGNAAHEARSPLNLIVNYLDIALQEEGLDQNLRESLTQGATASKSLIRVVDDLLNLAKVQEGEPTPVEELFDLEEMLEEATAMHRQEALHKGLHFLVASSRAAPAPRLLVGDSSQLRKIISNLCANAVQYTTHGGVRVEWGLEERLAMEGEDIAASEAPSDVVVVFKINDTGCGMSAGTLEAIFRQLEEVVAVDSKEEEQTASIGLGLAVVSNIIKGLNGQMRVESKPGSGTSFSIAVPLRLPHSSSPTPQPPRPTTPKEKWEIDTLLSAISASHMAPPEDVLKKATPALPPPDLGVGSSRPSASRSASSPLPRDSGSTRKEISSRQDASLKILVVDDEPINRRLLEKILMREGHEVKTCEHGGELLRLLELDGDWDLVLLDLQMPHMNGVETTRAIRLRETLMPFSNRRSIAINGRLPVFACSAQIEPEQMRKIVEAGFDGVLRKPINMRRLSVVVRGAVDPASRKAGALTSKWIDGGWLEASVGAA
ncbi:hypothetical protein BCR35DRAFT_354215 [Leucosporidium creatinivorum]|uniref:Uncharacterized protein n=1 Tax=Leucosporidium creatinivorum TaxID=106004 RepID=A0A1Y2ENF5_9BASI|nr:hypothetical protein BCR35DRAFT_354215 [Leucosporidium creatinivorum]